MEIIRQGKLKGDKEITHTCTNCDTIFKFKAKEGKFHISTVDGNWYEIHCPFCNSFRIVDA